MFSKKNSDKLQRIYKLIRVCNVETAPIFHCPDITGFEDKPLVSLEAAVQPLLSVLPAIDTYAYAAKQLCQKPPADGLTIDESASIMLYSMGWHPLNECLFYAINPALCKLDPQTFEIWHLYLKLFLTALSRLPPVERNVYRSINLDVSEHYYRGHSFAWRGFSSCTTLTDLIQPEFTIHKPGTRTVFSLKCKTARDISKHCLVPSGDEVVIIPGTKFQNRGYIYECDDLRIMQADEMFASPIFKKKFMQEKAANVIEREAGMYQQNQSPLTLDCMKMCLNGKERSFVPLLDVIPVKNVPPGKKRWLRNGVTVAGGNGRGQKLNQLHWPSSLHIHEDQTLYVCDCFNNRIVAWKCDATSGELVAGTGDEGKETNEFHRPIDIVFDQETMSFLISDHANRRVMRYPYPAAVDGEVYLEGVRCSGLATDAHGHLYVGDCADDSIKRWKMNDNDGSTRDKNGYVYFLDKERHEVRPWKRDVLSATIVAGNNNQGDRVSQLNDPCGIFVDHEQSIYVADRANHRVMKWEHGAAEGIVVAGGHGKGSSLKHLVNPQGLAVDELGDVYVADSSNNRIVCWQKGAKQGYLVLGSNEAGSKADQLNYPRGVIFDPEGNLYVVDCGNHRIQKFSIDHNSAS